MATTLEENKRPPSTTQEQIALHIARAKELAKTDLCVKIFIVASIVLAAIAIVAGILALMASKGTLPNGMSAITHLSTIGEVNSYVMLGGGIVLFVLGILAWSCQLQDETARERRLR